MCQVAEHFFAQPKETLDEAFVIISAFGVATQPPSVSPGISDTEITDRHELFEYPEGARNIGWIRSVVGTESKKERMIF